MSDYTGLGVSRRFYIDKQTNVVYQYIADATKIDNRLLVAICIRVHDNVVSMILGTAFSRLFIVAGELEIREAIAKNKSKGTALIQPPKQPALIV